MDVWVNFTNATKWQAEGIFKNFFPSKSSKEKEQQPTGIENKNVPGSKRKASVHAVPLLEEDEINVLAKRFAEQIPDDEMSVRFICYRRCL